MMIALCDFFGGLFRKFLLYLIVTDHDELDELERLRRENRRLKRQLEEKDMVVEL